MHLRASFPAAALALAALAIPLPAGAQASGASFTLSASPSYPAPYGQVTISVLSTSLDLANATMAVSVGGKKVYTGNVRPAAVTLGAAGALTAVTISITSGGATSVQTISFRPQDVALVAEPVSSAPPLYPGKPLVPLGGNARVVAVANLKTAGGKAIDPAALSYAWTVDGVQQGSSSGIGRNALIVASPLQYRDRLVSVTVQSQDGSITSGADLHLTAEAPTIRVYENDPLLGIRFDHALASAYAITGPEASLYGAAYSFPATNGAPTLQWFLSGAAAQTGPSITLRLTSAGAGTASLSLLASAGDATANAALTVSFGTSAASSGLFGL